MPDLMVRIDGKTLPLRSCFWVRYDPSGCAVGSLHGDMAATPDQVHNEFVTRQRDRDREARQGYRHELVTKGQWEATVYPCIAGKCAHRAAS